MQFFSAQSLVWTQIESSPVPLCSKTCCWSKLPSIYSHVWKNAGAHAVVSAGCTYAVFPARCVAAVFISGTSLAMIPNLYIFLHLSPSSGQWLTGSPPGFQVQPMAALLHAVKTHRDKAKETWRCVHTMTYTPHTQSHTHTRPASNRFHRPQWLCLAQSCSASLCLSLIPPPQLSATFLLSSLFFRPLWYFFSNIILPRLLSTHPI